MESNEKVPRSKRAKVTILVLLVLIVVSVACYFYFINRPAPDPVPMEYGIGNGVYVHIDADDFFGPFAEYTSDNVATKEYYLVYEGENFYVISMSITKSTQLLSDYYNDLLDFDAGIPFTGVTASIPRELAEYGTVFANELYETTDITTDYFLEVVGESLIDVSRNVNDAAYLFLIAALFLLLALLIVFNVSKPHPRKLLYQRGQEIAWSAPLATDANSGTPYGAAPADSYSQSPAYEMTSIEKEMAERQAKTVLEAAQAEHAKQAGGIYANDIYAGEIGKDQ